MVVLGLERGGFSLFFLFLFFCCRCCFACNKQPLIRPHLRFSRGATSREALVLCSNGTIPGVPPLNCCERSPRAAYQASEERPLLLTRTTKDGTVNAIYFLPTAFAAPQGSARHVAACFVLICRSQRGARISQEETLQNALSTWENLKSDLWWKRPQMGSIRCLPLLVWKMWGENQMRETHLLKKHTNAKNPYSFYILCNRQ